MRENSPDSHSQHGIPGRGIENSLKKRICAADQQPCVRQVHCAAGHIWNIENVGWTVGRGGSAHNCTTPDNCTPAADVFGDHGRRSPNLISETSKKTQFLPCCWIATNDSCYDRAANILTPAATRLGSDLRCTWPLVRSQLLCHDFAPHCATRTSSYCMGGTLSQTSRSAQLGKRLPTQQRREQSFSFISQQEVEVTLVAGNASVRRFLLLLGH